MSRKVFIPRSLVAIFILVLLDERACFISCPGECIDVKCPAYCNCSDRNVSCHNRSITYIPRIPCGIQSLDLNNCTIIRLSVKGIQNLTCSFETLTVMNLTDSKIRQFEEGAFGNLTKLEILDLSWNKIGENLKSNQSALCSLSKAPLHTLKLDGVWTEDGLVREIFKCFSGSHLTYLSMRENQIIEFEDKVLENFTNLVHLDLHGNWINKINLSSGIRTLEVFNLSHNQINIFPPNFCNQTTENSLYQNLKNLDLAWNQIIVPFSQNWNCLKGLESFNLSTNDMEEIPQNDSFGRLTSLKTLSLSLMKTTLKRIRNEAIKSNSLQYLDLSNNGLHFDVDKEVARDIFSYLPNLTSLDVSNNYINSVGIHRLTNLSSLETLIMRYVYLTELPDDFLQNFPNLTYLDLKGNKIEQFSANVFQNVRKLKFLNISYNLISNFPVPPLTPATLESLETFDFAYNYFQCDCEIVKLQKWINDVLSDPNKHNLLSRYPDDYWCYNPKSMYQVLLKDAKPDICTDSKYLLTLSIICSGIICLVFTVIIVIAYVYRWEIKFFLHRMRQKSQTCREGYMPLRSTFEYDTYVAYAEKDSAWVVHDLLNELREHNFNVYIRDRYAVPGVARCDEIVDNMYKSDTVILVLSKNFMACQWCNYQLNVAQARAVELNYKFIIPVFLEDISCNHMKISVQHLIRTSQPIEWAQQSTKNKLFWNQLKEALNGF